MGSRAAGDYVAYYGVAAHLPNMLGIHREGRAFCLLTTYSDLRIPLRHYCKRRAMLAFSGIIPAVKLSWSDPLGETSTVLNRPEGYVLSVNLHRITYGSTTATSFIVPLM
jgi:hypothetical protein